MKAYTYNQLPTHTQGVAKQQLTPHLLDRELDFTNAIIIGLYKRGLPAWEKQNDVLLTMNTLKNLDGLPPALYDIYDKMSHFGHFFYLEESIDGIVYVRSEHTDKNIAEDIGVDVKLVSGLRRVVSQLIEHKIVKVRYQLINEWVQKNGMPSLFTERGELITYDLHK